MARPGGVFLLGVAALLLTGCITSGVTLTPTPTPLATPTATRTPTATPSPTPTPTPILLPKAAFAVEGRAGQAPLTVSFLNQSQHATQYSWNFGDGGTSVEAQPTHTYTKAGEFTVSLVARSLVGPSILADTAVVRNVIQVLPGPLATLTVQPQTLRLEPKQTAQVGVTAQDAFGNNIPNASQIWAVASDAGNIDPSGLFQAGTKAASYPKALTLQAAFSGVTKTAEVDVFVVPGPLASATLSSSNDAVYTGDTATLHLAGFDAFGNSVTLSTAQWQSTAGLTTGNTSQGVLKTTRSPGPISVAVQASDGRKTVTANASVSVRQGFCETRTNQTQWSAVWRTYNADGSNGPIVGQQTLPSQFDQDWGSGPIVAGLSTNLLMVATSVVVVQRNGIVFFTVGADDGYRLKIADQEVLTNWNDHSYTASTYATNMVPGVYQLELDYYQDLNKARLSFSVDADVTSWTEATTCHGAYAEPPDTQYFVYQGGAEQASNVLNRFNIPGSQAGFLPSTLVGPSVLPGNRARTPSAKVVLIQGVDSNSNCDAPGSSADPIYNKIGSIVRGIQTTYLANHSAVGPFQDYDIIGFSYSGTYRNCNSRQPYSESSHPVNPTWPQSHTPLPQHDIVLPEYNALNTCSGVIPAAQRLAQLVQRIIAVDPDAPIILVGHSMGGMVATYYFNAIADPSTKTHLAKVITIDSPLTGTAIANPTSPCKSGQAWLDITGNSPVVGNIVQLGYTSDIVRVYNMTATDLAGRALPNAYTFASNCSTVGISTLIGAFIGLATGGWGLVIGPAIGLGSSFSSSHACIFYDTQSLAAIANVLFNEPTNGFRRVSGEIADFASTQRTVVSGSTTPFTVTVANKGNLTWNFGIMIKTRRPNGEEFTTFSNASVPVGGTATATAQFTWGVPGSRDVRVLLCQSPNDPSSNVTSGCTYPLADTGWLSGYITVVPQPTPTPSPTPTPTATPNPSAIVYSATVVIQSGKSTSVSIWIPLPSNVTIHLSISGGSGNDIDFSITGPSGSLTNYGRISGQKTYTLTVSSPGTYTLNLGNTFSFISSKTVTYTVTVSSP